MSEKRCNSYGLVMDWIITAANAYRPRIRESEKANSGTN